ncbi:uncharacterized protein LOC135226998 [Macrobrachium nipponense]|uniref:uncharacterized protein LOC135226998 n=1 Tax=Macrobrachium nipponense TaxID=159736 RepID=UPI0030C81838
MASNEPEKEHSLCILMARLKMENPNLGRKEMHSAVVAEGPEWEKLTVEEISNMWRRMKRRNAKIKENIATAGNQNAECNGHTSSKNPSLQESGACGKQGTTQKLGQGNSKMGMKTAQERQQDLQDHKAIDMTEVSEALGGVKVLKADANKSPALVKQLKRLEEYPGVNYVVFTPPDEYQDCAVKLTDAVGEVFFYVMWNRVVRAPYGSKTIKRELWMIYQQLEGIMLPKYRKMLRNQLQEEFGIDPFEGK